MPAAKIVPFLALLIVGCSDGTDTEPETDDTSATEETSPVSPTDTDDSGESDTDQGTDTPTDSGETDLPQPPNAVWTLDPQVTCADPSLREETKYTLHTPQGDWASQPYNPASNSLFIGGGVTVADFDGDDLLDIMLTSVTDEMLYYGQTADLSFERRDLPTMPIKTTGSTAADYDGDGDLDLFVSSFRQGIELLVNDGSGVFSTADLGTLLDVEVPTELRAMAVSFADYDLDGDLDFFLPGYGAIGGSSGLPPGDRNYLFTHQADGTFQELLGDPITNLAMRESHTFGGAWWDVDTDGQLDLLLLNDFGTRIKSQVVLQAQGSFDSSFPVRDLGYNGEAMGLSFGDLNGDQIDDLFFAAWDDYGLLMSDAATGTWINEATIRGVIADYDRGHNVAWGSEFVDIDNDTDLDLMIAHGFLPVNAANHENPQIQRDAIWINTPDENGLPFFEDVAEDWGMDQGSRGRGFVTVDINRDGWLDVVKRDLRGPTTLHLANCGEEAWLVFDFQRSDKNTEAIATRVKITHGDQVWWRTLRAGGTNYQSMGPAELHFGLGDIDTVELVEVYWPDGEVSTYENLPTRRYVHVEHVPLSARGAP